MKRNRFLFLFCAFFALTGCNEDLKVIYKSTVNQDFVSFKRVHHNDTVVLVVTDDLAKNIEPGKELAEKLSSFPFNVVLVHQASTKDPALIEQYYMTDQEAEVINDLSSKILSRTIGHFKNQGMYVIIYGESFGSFIPLRTLNKYGKQADRYAMVNSRLNLDEALLRNAEQLKVVSQASGNRKTKAYVVAQKNWVEYRLLTNLAKPRYIDLLRGEDLSSFLFTYRSDNKELGSLTSEEIAFIESGKGSVKLFHNASKWTNHELNSILSFVRK